MPGLQDRILDLKAGSDRSSERYIFDESSILDSAGKNLAENDSVFFPALSIKSSTPILKGFRCVWFHSCLFMYKYNGNNSYDSLLNYFS